MRYYLYDDGEMLRLSQKEPIGLWSYRTIMASCPPSLDCAPIPYGWDGYLDVDDLVWMINETFFNEKAKPRTRLQRIVQWLISRISYP